MEFRQLEYFLATARLNNMTEAARQMHVSQPSLSNAVKSLETELGVPLFNRHGKRIELNEAGRYFAPRVSSAMDVVTEAKDVVSQKDREREHTVNCTLGIPMGNQGKLISSFFKVHPDITVRVGYPSSKLFENQTIDLHLFGTSVDLDDTNVIKLGYERYVLILPKNHPLADRGEINLSEMAQERLIMTEPSEIYNETKSMCRSAGFEPKIAYETQVCFEAINMVEAGLGYSIAAEFTWLSGMNNDIAVIPIADQQRGRYLYARMNEGAEPTEAVWKFIDFLQDYSDSLVSE